MGLEPLMASVKVALDALQALLSGAKRVDLGDMTRPVTVARKQALADMLPKADDWGWKGGKPGEVTGGEYLRLYDDAVAAASAAAKNVKKPRGYTEGMDYLRQQEYLDKMYEQLGDVTDKFAEQMRPNLENLGLGADALDGYGIETIYDYARQFADFEKADIPREFTGAAFRILNTQRSGPGELDAKTIRGALRSTWRQLTNDEREAFLALLPEWSGSLDELADAARNL